MALAKSSIPLAVLSPLAAPWPRRGRAGLRRARLPPVPSLRRPSRPPWRPPSTRRPPFPPATSHMRSKARPTDPTPLRTQRDGASRDPPAAGTAAPTSPHDSAGAVPTPSCLFGGTTLPFKKGVRRSIGITWCTHRFEQLAPSRPSWRSRRCSYWRFTRLEASEPVKGAGLVQAEGGKRTLRQGRLGAHRAGCAHTRGAHKRAEPVRDGPLLRRLPRAARVHLQRRPGRSLRRPRRRRGGRQVGARQPRIRRRAPAHPADGRDGARVVRRRESRRGVAPQSRVRTCSTW